MNTCYIICPCIIQRINNFFVAPRTYVWIYSKYCGRLDVSKSTGLSVFCNSLNISSPLTSTIIGLSAVFSGLYCSAQQRQLTDTTKFKIKKGMTGIIPWSWWRCKTDYANAPPTHRSQPLAAGVLPPAFLSLSNLLSRKFENLLKCPQKNHSWRVVFMVGAARLELATRPLWAAGSNQLS